MQAESQVRDRLMAGFCDAVERKGLAATTIIDVATCAQVSKRTFYEHFRDKEDCFVATYRALAADLMHAVVDAAGAERDWEDQIDAAVRAYLGRLDERPALTRAFFLEIHAAGHKALAVRREVLVQFAEVTRNLVAGARVKEPALAPLSPTMAMAIVGGINELLLLKVEKSLRLGDLAETAVELVRAVVSRTDGGSRRAHYDRGIARAR
jgi:AcrR family transcriptional regulator